jgi:hypothetical protein
MGTAIRPLGDGRETISHSQRVSSEKLATLADVVRFPQGMTACNTAGHRLVNIGSASSKSEFGEKDLLVRCFRFGGENC